MFDLLAATSMRDGISWIQNGIQPRRSGIGV